LKGFFSEVKNNHDYYADGALFRGFAFVPARDQRRGMCHFGTGTKRARKQLTNAQRAQYNSGAQ
jgi:hypothetical protein